MKGKVYLALLHNPVYNKNMKEITTTVTNFDLHDIARTAKTYGIINYYIVNHLQSQKEMVKRIKDYWMSQFGAEYNADRKTAFEIIKIKEELANVITDIKEAEGEDPVVVTTDAREYENTLSFAQLREKLNSDGVYLILLGTGWGLTKEVISDSDYILEPIHGQGDYNHLSVRAAAAIILDRLLGQ